MKWKMLFIACLVASTIGVGVYRGSFLSTKSGFEDNFEGFEAPMPRNGRIIPPAPDEREANPKGPQATFPVAQMVSAYQSTVDECTKKEKEAARLAKEIKANPDPAKEAALRDLLDQIFEQKHAAQEAEVKELSKKLSRLQESLVTRKSKKTEIVTRHIKELQGEPDETAWDVSPRKKEIIVRRGMTLEDAYEGGIEENFGPQNRGARLPGFSLNLQNLGPQVMSVPKPPQPARAISNPAPVVEPRRMPQAKDTVSNSQTGNASQNDRGTTVVSADTFHLASQWAALVRALDALKSSSQQQKFANDPKSLELEWELTKVKLREAEETFTSQTAKFKSGGVGQDELRKSRFAVEKAKLEAALAEQRVKLATEPPKNSQGTEGPKEKSGNGRSARSSATKILILEQPAEDCTVDFSAPVPCEDSPKIPNIGLSGKTNSNPKGEPANLKTEKSPAKGRTCLEIQLNKGDTVNHQFILSLVFSLPRFSIG